MGRAPPGFKRIVAAAAAAVWFSAPLAAQDVPQEPGQDAPGTLPESAGQVPSPEGSAPAATAQEREADLLRQLAGAESPEAAGLIEAELTSLWSQSGSPAVDLLLRRGQDALEAGEPEVAIEHFTAAIDHAPAFAEPYAGRAAAYYLTNRVGPAIDDLREALVLNPSHLGALQGFGVILEELGRDEDALEIFRRVADMDPQDAEAQAAADRLALAIEGLTL